jgi:hemolysin-activating ACP:hemolysin acyltransferase
MRPPVADTARALGLLAAVLDLYESSPLHFIQPVQMMFDRIFPSLLNGQYRLLMKGERPLSFVNWAWLTPELSQQLLDGRAAIAPDQWTGGRELWFMEIVARDGMMPSLVRDLQSVFPPGTHARWLRIGPSGEVQGIGEVRMPGKAPPELGKG